MSSLPYSFFINFSSTKIKVSQSVSRLNAIFITKPTQILNNFETYFDTTQVISKYGINSNEKDYAESFFGFQNKNGKFAEVIYSYNLYENPTPATLKGTSVNLSKLLVNGSFGVTIGNRTEQITVDLTNKVSLTDIATAIQDEINNLGTELTEAIPASPTTEDTGSREAADEAVNQENNPTNTEEPTEEPTSPKIPTTTRVIRDEDLSFKNAKFFFNNTTNGFELQSGITGSLSNVGYVTSGASNTDLSSFLGMSEADGAIIYEGKEQETFPEALQKIISNNGDYYSISTLFDLNDDELETLAKTIATTQGRYIAIAGKSNKQLLSINNPYENLVGYDGLVMNFNPTIDKNINVITQAYLASLDLTESGSAMSINFTNATKFDSVNTISNTIQINNLNSNRANGIFAVGDFGERSVFYGEGKIYGDMYKSIDSYAFNSFIKFNIEKAMFSQLANSNIIGGRSDVDIQLLRDTAVNQCENFVNAGIIVANPILAQSEKVSLQKVLNGNQDDYNSCLNNGYVFQFVGNSEDSNGSVISEFRLIFVMNIATSRIKISAMFI